MDAMEQQKSVETFNLYCHKAQWLSHWNISMLSVRSINAKVKPQSPDGAIFHIFQSLHAPSLTFLLLTFPEDCFSHFPNIDAFSASLTNLNISNNLLHDNPNFIRLLRLLRAARNIDNLCIRASELPDSILSGFTVMQSNSDLMLAAPKALVCAGHTPGTITTHLWLGKLGEVAKTPRVNMLQNPQEVILDSRWERAG
ncbi:uncharacterized protein BT62DRAFT_1011311 [Guyanagaster necrorhizus]|uniref:Uncharacterized protein n=1 Tax=Guyanagaster necrorhizus TaxID=856835 RepID=A0A9P8ANE3_9AGAR|nr:uncharacterized protein BT62DRAFT_1011311 [Guyanagaster necrorhizus MCA 3950]KAG7441739.1 hypothetical protein BT62DRAFT_1011311 [Guyanagaster necrorhizus MCA 3950]